VGDLVQILPLPLGEPFLGRLVVAQLGRVGERRDENDSVLLRDLENPLDLALVESEHRVRDETQIGRRQQQVLDGQTGVEQEVRLAANRQIVVLPCADHDQERRFLHRLVRLREGAEHQLVDRFVSLHEHEAPGLQVARRGREPRRVEDEIDFLRLYGSLRQVGLEAASLADGFESFQLSSFPRRIRLESAE